MIAAKIATMKQGARTDLTQNQAKSQPEAASMLNASERGAQSARAASITAAPSSPI